MVKSKREQILELCEFDQNKLLEIAWRQKVSSVELENARLLPIITALLDRVEQLEGALDKIDRAYSKRMTNIWLEDKMSPEEYLNKNISEAIDSIATSPLDKILEAKQLTHQKEQE